MYGYLLPVVYSVGRLLSYCVVYSVGGLISYCVVYSVGRLMSYCVVCVVFYLYWSLPPVVCIVGGLM